MEQSPRFQDSLLCPVAIFAESPPHLAFSLSDVQGIQVNGMVAGGDTLHQALTVGLKTIRPDRENRAQTTVLCVSQISTVCLPVSVGSISGG